MGDKKARTSINFVGGSSAPASVGRKRRIKAKVASKGARSKKVGKKVSRGRARSSRQMAKKLANRFSGSFGNPWHGVKTDTRRKLNTDKSKKGKKK